MKKHFGEILRDLRESKGMSVNQLAMYSRVSSGLISKIENKKRGTPKPETIEKLAKGLKVKYEELMLLAEYTTDKKENAFALSESDIEMFIKEQEEKYNVNLHDDPIVYASMKQIIETIAQTKASQQNQGNR